MKKVIITMCSISCLFCIFIVSLMLIRLSRPATVPLINSTPISTESLHINTEGKLNINTATVQELTVLSGIGEVLAQRIVEYREKNGPYKDTSDLLNIKGIGPVKLKNIIDQIYVS